MSREFWQVELDQLLNEVDTLTEDWSACSDMVAKAMDTPDKKVLFEYLRELVPRLKQMRRDFNRVKMKEGAYVVENYTFDFYKWAKNKGIETITPNQIVVAPLDLTPNERDAFNRRLDR